MTVYYEFELLHRKGLVRPNHQCPTSNSFHLFNGYLYIITKGISKPKIIEWQLDNVLGVCIYIVMNESIIGVYANFPMVGHSCLQLW